MDGNRLLMAEQSKPILLVVDDDTAINETLAEHWKTSQIPFSPLFVETAEEALKVMSQKPVGVLLTDLHLPDATGLFIMSEVNRRYPLVKIIMMTAKPTEETKAKALALGAVDFLAKPFKLDQLDQLMRGMPARESTGFTGVMKSICLADLVQLKCSSFAQVKIVLKGGNQEGVLFWNKGVMTFAKCGDVKGPDAFYKMFNWTRGTFEEFPYTETIAPNLPPNWEGLLLEAAQKKDENTIPTDTDFSDIEIEPSSQTPDLKEHEQPPAEDCLFKLADLGYVSGSLMCTRSGSLRSSNIADKPNQAAALSAFLTQQGQCLAQLIDEKSVQKVFVRTASKQTVVYPRGQVLVGVVMPSDLDVWPVDDAMKAAIKK